MYEDFKVYGPYLGKDGRLRVCLVNSSKRKMVSYPKFLMENHLGRYLKPNETIDHIDGNPLNNELENLRILERKEHSTLDVLRNKDLQVTCKWCGKILQIQGSSIHNRNRSGNGYFCSRKCSGKFGSSIQKGFTQPEKVEKLKPEKFKLKESAPGETLEVEVG